MQVGRNAIFGASLFISAASFFTGGIDLTKSGVCTLPSGEEIQISEDILSNLDSPYLPIPSGKDGEKTLNAYCSDNIPGNPQDWFGMSLGALVPLGIALIGSGGVGSSRRRKDSNE